MITVAYKTKGDGPPRVGMARGGFTLLEALIALSLISIVLAALYASFFTAHRAVTGGGDTLIRLQELRAAMDMLRVEVEAALMDGDGANPFLIKDRDIYGRQASELSFTTHASPIPGPCRVSYHVVEREDRLVLVKRLRTAATPEREALEAEALETIGSFTVEAVKGREWLKTWQEPDLPEEIKITVTVPVKDRELTLSTAIRPRAGRRL